MKGFTLIELIVVFMFIGVLTALGIASYTSYNSTQSVQSAASDVVTILNTAKSSAISQVIPSSCTNPVTGYEVDITLSGQPYTLYAVCSGKQQITTSNLPPNVTFANGSATSVFFAISTGAVASPDTIFITGYGKTKKITVSQTGSVSVN